MSSATANPVDEPVDSPDVVRETAGVDRVLRLLAIYRKKLQVAVSDYLDYATEESPTTLGNPKTARVKTRPATTAYRPLIPGVRKLAQYASGLIENARLPQLDKIELQLRLAELEAALEFARKNILR